MSATTIRDNNAFEATMNAVIIYDRFDFAAKAKAMLERAAHGTGEATHWSVKPWRVDMLKLPPAAEAALAEAAEAHLIVLALRQVQSLFPWLADWLARWATCRQVQEAALAVWDSGNADTRPVRATPELSQFAGRHGLSLILDDNALVKESHRGGNLKGLKIPAPAHDNQSPAALRIWRMELERPNISFVKCWELFGR